MKHFIIPMMLMAAAALASCEKQNTLNEPEVQKATYTYTISATAPEMEDVNAAGTAQAPTKTDNDSEGHFSWSAGDAISVLFHNDEGTNKFFTLTTTGSGATATFSGPIDAGYKIGASDGDGSDKKIWVLFPASKSHTYTTGSAPQFFMNPETDFTAAGAHWSANLPMYDLLTAEGNIVFKNLCSGFVFTFTNINAAVNKVMLTVDNNAKTYKVSGLLPLVLDSGEYCIKPDWGDAGAARMISYIANVDAVNHKAVFYVPTRRATTYFQPVLDLVDYETGNTLSHLVAGTAKASPAKGKVQPISVDTDNTVGTPPSFTSKFGITWGSVSDSVAGNSASESDHNNMVSVFKAKADDSYVYVYFEMNIAGLLCDPSYSYANSIDMYLGNSESANSAWMWDSSTKYSIHPFTAWLTKSGVPAVNSWEGVYGGSADSGGKCERYGSKVIYEVRLKRSYDASMQITGTLNIGMVINYQKYSGGSLGSYYMYVPSNGNTMLQIDAPAYVAS